MNPNNLELISILTVANSVGTMQEKKTKEK